MDHYVTTRSERQRRIWQELFYLDALPVRDPFPHEEIGANGVSAYFYRLDPARMSAVQLHRLAAHVTARRGGEYAAVLDEIRVHGWGIDATHCELVQPTVERPSAVFIAQRQKSMALAW